MPSFYCEKHPDSTFNKFMKISIFTPDSNLTIVGNAFKIYRNGRVEQHLVPCHRVIGANGSLTGYAAGIEAKKFLLAMEKRYAA